MKTILPKNSQWGRIRRQIVDAASGRVVMGTGWEHNLVFDSCLNALANSIMGGGPSGFAYLFSKCLIGSGTNPNTIASGSISFLQAGTTVTASGAFFTTAMIGGILKYGASGSAGLEQYISSVAGGGLTAVVSTSQTITLATAGTVWQVQQTALQTGLLASSTYDTGALNNSTTFTGNVVTMLRTFVFPVQGAPYSVNEIGYAAAGMAGYNANGRVVLSSTDVVAPSQFYRVQIEMTYTQLPSAPVAAPNVGTGIDMSGTDMLQVWDCSVVTTTGTSAQKLPVQTQMGFCDLSLGQSGWYAFHTANDITLNGSILTGAPVFISEPLSSFLNGWTNSGQPVGVGICSNSFSIVTAGQVLYSIVLGGTNAGNFASQTFVHVFTTPVVLPTGSFAGTFIFQIQFGRTLAN